MLLQRHTAACNYFILLFIEYKEKKTCYYKLITLQYIIKNYQYIIITHPKTENATRTRKILMNENQF